MTTTRPMGTLTRTPMPELPCYGLHAAYEALRWAYLNDVASVTVTDNSGTYEVTDRDDMGDMLNDFDMGNSFLVEAITV